MEYPLHIGRQTWKPRRDGDLTLFLPPSPWGVSLGADFEFVPPWLDDEDYASEHRTMHLRLHGYLPGLCDWRELAGFELKESECEEEPGGEVLTAMQGPEIEIWSSGQGPGSIHTHAQAGWQTRLALGQLEVDEHGPAWLCEVEAFFPSERAREANAALWMRQFFSTLEFDNEEQEKLLEEGWRFHYRGRVRLEQLSCTVPLNTSDPIGWARRMAARELKMNEFGLCRVNGGDFEGNYRPEDGVCSNGRLVLLSPASAWFSEHQRRKKEERRKRKDGEAGK